MVYCFIQNSIIKHKHLISYHVINIGTNYYASGASSVDVLVVICQRCVCIGGLVQTAATNYFGKGQLKVCLFVRLSVCMSVCVIIRHFKHLNGIINFLSIPFF